MTQLSSKILPVYLIAKNEFGRIAYHPMVIVIFIVLLILALLNGAGNEYNLSMMEKTVAGKDVFISIGLSRILYNTSLYCTIMAMFIGLLSITDDRSKNLFKVIITKPLYRRDLIMGKFIGINIFLLIFITLIFLISTLLMITFFRTPESMTELAVRLSLYILMQFFECSLTSAIAILIGILFKNTLESVILASSYLFIELYCYLTKYIGSLAIISPRHLYYTILAGNFDKGLLDTSITVAQWIEVSAPFTLLMILEIVAFLALDCVLFTKSDE